MWKITQLTKCENAKEDGECEVDHDAGAITQKNNPQEGH